MNHHIERTSRKGEVFLGTCRLCGQRDLPASAAKEECPNARGLTEAEALSEVVDGDLPSPAKTVQE